MRIIRLILVVLALTGSPVWAHLTPNSEINLEFGRDRIEATLIIPLGELQFAEPRFGDLRAGPLNAGQRQRLRLYLDTHLAAAAPDDRRWRMTLNTADIAHEPLDLEAHISLRPPAGAPVRRLRFAMTQ